jgi:hypothetical protein
MTAADMIYDFKQKLNKIDSQSYRNLLIPEIDWKLNDAQSTFIKMIANPRYRPVGGFEYNQRTIDDIRSIVNDSIPLIAASPSEVLIAGFTYVKLPEDYMYYASSELTLKKQNCQASCRCIVRSHNDRFEESPFDKSSFEWREVNILFCKQGIRIYLPDNTTIVSYKLSYIRKPKYIHDAQHFNATVAMDDGTYTLPSGEILKGSQDCELPDAVHSEIVDLAVLIATGDLVMDYGVKRAKVDISN